MTIIFSRVGLIIGQIIGAALLLCHFTRVQQDVNKEQLRK